MTKTLHFKIDGADLTRLARERMLDDAPGSAWRIATSLIGDGVADAAIKILQGTAKLVGNESAMSVKPDSSEKAKKYRERLAWLFAGRIRVRDTWYRPVAYVSDMGPKDMTNDHGRPIFRVQHTEKSAGGYLNREWHYVGKDETVLDNACYLDGGVEREVIFRQCGERPHWEHGPLTPQLAVQEFLDAGRTLEERSHTKLYGSTSAEWWGDGDDDDVMPVAKALSMRVNRAPRTEKERNQEREDAATETRREEARKAELARLRVKILAQAGTDLIELKWDKHVGYEDQILAPAGSAMIPRAPFLNWAFKRMLRFNAVLPEWQPVCPSGMKMPLDDPYHTDWVVAAGFDPEDRALYSGPINDAAMQLASDMQDKFDRPAVHVLVDGRIAHGVIVHGRANTPLPNTAFGSIVVLPNLHPKYLAAVEHAAAVITQAGGATAHLAQVGRERALPIVLIPDALALFPVGESVTVDTAERSVVRHYTP